MKCAGAGSPRETTQTSSATTFMKAPPRPILCNTPGADDLRTDDGAAQKRLARADVVSLLRRGVLCRGPQSHRQYHTGRAAADKNDVDGGCGHLHDASDPCPPATADVQRVLRLRLMARKEQV